MSGPFDKELETIANRHTQDFARRLAFEVQNLILRKLGIEQSPTRGARSAPTEASKPAAASAPKSATKSAGKKASVKPAPAAQSKAAAAKKPASGSQKKRSNGDDRASAIDKVFRVIQQRDGVAVSDVVKATNLDRGPVAAALKALKEKGSIFMGGNRRFARYAVSQAAADRASEAARKG